MFIFKEKELLFTVMGLTVHRPDVKEARILAAVILVICTIAGLKTGSLIEWALIALICTVGAAFDLIPPEKPLRTLCISLVAGAIIGYIANP
jgi:cell division protein FtsW (lipid II flippase)